MKTIVDSFILGKSVVLSRSRWKEKQQTCAGRRGLGKSMHVIHVQVCTWNDGSSRFCQWSGINSDPTSYVAVRGGHPKKSLHPTLSRESGPGSIDVRDTRVIWIPVTLCLRPWLLWIICVIFFEVYLWSKKIFWGISYLMDQLTPDKMVTFE